jgi:hypothetical protein
VDNREPRLLVLPGCDLGVSKAKCSKCAQTKPSKDFPRKNKSQPKSVCRSCWNGHRRKKRGGTSDSKGTRDVAMELSSTRYDWVGIIFQALKTNGFLGNGESADVADIDLDVLLRRRGGIKDFLQEK